MCMADDILYQQGSVTVTNTLFKNGNESFAIKQVNAVKKLHDKPANTGSGCLILLGLMLFMPAFFAMLAGSGKMSMLWSVILPGAMLAFGAAAWKKPSWVVLLRMSSGEAPAYRSKDEAEVDAIVAAVQKAL